MKYLHEPFDIGVFLFCLLFITFSCTEQVKEIPVSSIAIGQNTAEMIVGETLQLCATVAPSDATNKEIIWTSSNTSVATISTNGIVSALKEGTSTIYAMAETKKDQCTVTVKAKVIPVESVTLDTTGAELTPGGQKTLSVTIKPDNATTRSVVWSSSDESVATVIEGVITANNPGIANITAKCEDKSSSCTVTVRPIEVESITLDKKVINLKVGQTSTLQANVLPEDATEKCVTWLTSDETIASVSDGIVTAIKVGEATITATAGGKKDICNVTVEPTEVTSITIDKTYLKLKVGDVAELSATVKPDDATDKTVTWSSDNDSVAKVSHDGTVTAIGVGECSIIAKAGNGLSSSCNTVVITYEDLCVNGTANCYIINKPGCYKFNASIKGNSTEPVGSPQKAQVLWETFGTNSVPQENDIIKGIFFDKGWIYLSTSEPIKDGNALVAVTDTEGTILWSWHLWICKDYDPVETEQTYYNNAGIMMDRNLGATSTSPGSGLCFGLLYQWGRKDPFIGNWSNTDDNKAASTIEWPKAVMVYDVMDKNKDAISYSVHNPTTLIREYIDSHERLEWFGNNMQGKYNGLWGYEDTKSVYDPCPSGWRIPEGGPEGIWKKAEIDRHNFDQVNKGILLFYQKNYLSTWYPASGFMSSGGKNACHGQSAYWLTRTPLNNYDIYCMSIRFDISEQPINIMANTDMNSAQSIRCQKE